MMHGSSLVLAGILAGVTSAAAADSGPLAVEAVVFDLDYVGGVGGFTYPQYEPVYLLNDGRACRCTQVAVEDLTEQVLEETGPARTGQWRAAGNGFVITYADGSKPEEVSPDLARPAPIPEGTPLSGLYRSIGGGGNLAMGGGTMTAHVEDITFFPDGSFSQSDLRYGDSPPGGAYSKRGAAGDYHLEGPTLTLNYRDGRTVRTSAFYSSKRKESDNFGPLGVLWIGGEAFTRRE